MELGLFIDGKSQPAAGGSTYQSINPATEEVWATVAAASTQDVEAAVAAASRAHKSGVWRGKSPAERAEILSNVANLIYERADELGLAEVQDSGGTIRKANTADVPMTAQTFLHYAEMLGTVPEEEVFEEFVPVPSRNIVRREPYGVCACIVPFNFPMCSATWKIVPAIAAGNTVVLKPSPYTPVTALMLAQICHEAGVPAGVVNVVTGPGSEIGEALVDHPDVAKVSFTGSTTVGKRIMEVAATSLKKLTLELGGKSPNIILEDADLECAVRGALFGTFFHSGQLCESGTRILIHRSKYEEFAERLAAGAAEIKVGDTMDPEIGMGPLVSDRQLANTKHYVAVGLEEGATIAYGGGRPKGIDKGYYHQPTIFTAVRNDMRIAQEEIFGPVVSLIPFDNDDEAVEIANDSMYGLGGAVWSRDVDRALGLAGRIESGTIWINDYHLLNLRFPFGGYKQSGIGRELGPWGLAEYQQLKHIHVGEPSSAEEKYYFDLLLG